MIYVCILLLHIFFNINKPFFTAVPDQEAEVHLTVVPVGTVLEEIREEVIIEGK